MTNSLKIWENTINYPWSDSSKKKLAHRMAKKVLRDFATNYLKLSSSQFDIRSNLGGPAVSGEVTLHTDVFPNGEYGIYIQISQSCAGLDSTLFRTCKSSRDYVGGTNNFVQASKTFSNENNKNDFLNLINRLCRVQ